MNSNSSQTGVVKWFDSKKGYGFIIPDDGGPDMFIHATELEKSRVNSLKEQDRVSYNVGRSKGKTQAVDLKIVR